MEVQEQQGNGLRYLMVHPDDYQPERDYPLVVMLHGFGTHMGDLAGLAPAIDKQGYIYACPNAPLSFEFGPGTKGYGWTEPRNADGPEGVERTVALLEGFFAEVMDQYRVAPGRVILVGFSQGGIMTYRCGLGKPEVFAGLVALSSTISDVEDIRARLPATRSQPLFIAHGINDPLISVERAYQTKAFLEEEGYTPFFKEYPIGHEISQEVLDDLVPWMKKVLPSLRGASTSP